MHPDEDSKLPYTPLPRSLTEDIGEDPARWLDGPLAPLPRIRGLRTIKRVRGWQAAERLLASRQDRDPRERIMAALDEREAYLDQHGEFNPGLPEREIVLGITPGVLEDVFGSPEAGGLARITPSEEPTWDESVDRGRTTLVWDPDRVRERLQQRTAATPARPVAADGGEERGQ